MLRQFILLLTLMLGAGVLLARIPEAQATPPWQLPPVTIQRASVASSGAQANNSSASPSGSSDGRFVAFASEASSLVAGDTNGVEDIFVHDRQTGETRRVSVASDGAQGTNSSSSPSISADGRFITFRSLANNLVPDDNNQTWDIFIVANPLWVPVSPVPAPPPAPAPAPPPVATVAPADGLKPVGDNLVRVWGYDGATQKFQLYDPAVALLSDLKALNRGQGYWINVKSAQKVTLGTNEYNLVAGWNLVGWVG